MALSAKADEKASKIAADLMRPGPLDLYRKSNPARYREKLERAAVLDPTGENGRRARQLLVQTAKKP